MYCKKCGSEIEEGAKYCARCGYCAEDPLPAVQVNEPIETAAVVFAILGFIIPLIGLIATLVYYKEKPRDAKVIGIASFVGFIFWAFWWY